MGVLVFIQLKSKCVVLTFDWLSQMLEVMSTKMFFYAIYTTRRILFIYFCLQIESNNGKSNQLKFYFIFCQVNVGLGAKDFVLHFLKKGIYSILLFNRRTLLRCKYIKGMPNRVAAQANQECPSCAIIFAPQFFNRYRTYENKAMFNT